GFLLFFLQPMLNEVLAASRIAETPPGLVAVKSRRDGQVGAQASELVDVAVAIWQSRHPFAIEGDGGLIILFLVREPAAGPGGRQEFRQRLLSAVSLDRFRQDR